MAKSLHTTTKYEKEYGRNAINGWVSVDRFLDFLKEWRREEDTDIYISEDENIIEIPFYELEQMKVKYPKWSKVINIILKDSDKRNNFAYLEIW